MDWIIFCSNILESYYSIPNQERYPFDYATCMAESKHEACIDSNIIKALSIEPPIGLSKILIT